MKCIVYFEFCPEDMDKVIAKHVEAQQSRKKEPNRFGTILFPSQYTGTGKGFTITDATQEQFNNAQVFWFPEMSLQYIPCDDVSNWIKNYMASKK